MEDNLWLLPQDYQNYQTCACSQCRCLGPRSWAHSGAEGIFFYPCSALTGFWRSWPEGRVGGWEGVLTLSQRQKGLAYVLTPETMEFCVVPTAEFVSHLPVILRACFIWKFIEVDAASHLSLSGGQLPPIDTSNRSQRHPMEAWGKQLWASTNHFLLTGECFKLAC